MFAQPLFDESYNNVSIDKKSEIAITFITCLCHEEAGIISEGKTSLLARYIHDIPTNIVTLEAHINKNEIISNMDSFGRWCLTEMSHGSHDLLFDAIGYLYIAAASALKNNFSKQELHQTTHELLSSAATMRFLCHKGCLSQSEPNVIGYKQIAPWTAKQNSLAV